MMLADREDARARWSASARRARAVAAAGMWWRGGGGGRGRRPAQDWIKFTLVMAAGVIASGARAQDVWSCCDKAEGSCRSVCEKMSEMAEMASDGALREDRIRNIYKFCSPALIEFWICMNATIQEVMAGDGWWGRACCSAARGAECRRTCATGRDAGAATAACRRSDELAFFECVQRQRDAQDCCSQTQSVECHDACRDALWRALRDAGADAARVRAVDSCESSPLVAQCVRNLTRVPTPTDPLKYVGCCQQSESAECRAACARVLRGGGADARDVLEALVAGGCGAPLPHDAFWQCFLRKDSRVAQPTDRAAVDRLGLDAAKLHCCRKGKSARCRRLCTGTYDRAWLDSRPAFEAECLASTAELELAACLQEVEEPCVAGCEGLAYCTNFNSRPTELFRGCSPAADLAAHLHLNWQRARGYLKLGELQLPVHNSSRCSPELWRAVACVLHVKPCVHQTHSSRLCREDCLRLVSECVRWDAARALPVPAAADLTAQQLCRDIAHEEEDAPCVRLADYIIPPPAPDEAAAGEGTWSPCASAPCNTTEVCVVNRACTRADACPRYLCLPGCPVGESSELVVPVGTLVRVPLGGATDGCVKICECGVRGTLQHCRPLPCVPYDDCTLLDHTVPHGATYYMECNKCKCYAGELACSQRACAEETAGGTALLTRLPCNCPAHYLPVCVAGRTLASVCLARCSGYDEQETVSGACAGQDSCARAVCPAGHVCVSRPTVCLSPLQAPCLQYQCVKPDDCAGRPEPVCDTSGATHVHVCALVASGCRLSYRGACRQNCKGEAEGAVCGADGATYSSACAAAAALVSVDYSGACIAVGAISYEPSSRCTLERVTCAPLARPGCRAFTAPGACCPRCGGALRILYSKKQVQRALYVLATEEDALSVRALVAALARQVGVAECEVRGHLTVEAELFVSVESVTERPSALQARACELEAERLATLVNAESARFSTELPLSLLLLALPVHAPLSSTALATVPTLPLLLLPLLVLAR